MESLVLHLCSLSVSSGDSDDPSFATASSHHSGVVSYRPPVGGHHHHHHHPHHLRGGGGGMQGAVMYNYQLNLNKDLGQLKLFTLNT